jgi:hypothetical protein
LAIVIPGENDFFPAIQCPIFNTQYPIDSIKCENGEAKVETDSRAHRGRAA